MLNRLPTPTQLPALSLILADIGQPTPAQLGQALGVSPASARRWVQQDSAPRPVALALWWLTRWGMSVIECEAVNAAAINAGLVRSLQDDLARSRAQLAHLVNLADFGAANDPLHPFQSGNLLPAGTAARVAGFVGQRLAAPLCVNPRPQAWQLTDHQRGQHGAG